jgi:cell division protease FtsH
MGYAGDTVHIYGGKQLNQISRNLLFWVAICLLMLVLFRFVDQPRPDARALTYTEFMQRVEAGDVRQVTLRDNRITGVLVRDGRAFETYAPNDPELVRRLMDRGVAVRAEPPETAPWYMTLLISWFPMLLLIGVWIFFMRQMQGGGKAMQFGRSKARMISQDAAKVRFTDVAGVDEAKEELPEIVEFLANPRKFTRLGGRIPKGVLLVGPPGTGKTLLANAVAGEAGVPFFSISGSEFMELFVGVGAARVRDMFLQGKKNAPCVIFIDEIDAVGRQRGAGLGGGHDEREQTLNQLLVEMDGFETNEGVIMIAATNRTDVLDPALLRPGRFDRQVVVATPDVRGRLQILEVHVKRAPLDKTVELERLARGTPGFSGADLENLVNEAALQAAKHDKEFISMSDFEYAKDKVLMGKERRSLILSEEEKRITAYHEAGHALMAKLSKNADPIHKVSIIPRGRALGVTMQLPEGDRHGYSRSYLLTNLAVLLSGRVAEELVFGDITTGAGNDIDRASKLARKMVGEWGMSEKIGPIAIGEQGAEVFIGREWMQHRNFSEDTARLMDAEVKRLIEEALTTSRNTISSHMDELHTIAAALLDKETITGEDLDALIKGEPLPETPKPAARKRRASTKKQAAAPLPEGEVLQSEQEPEQPGFTLEPDDDPR